MESPSSQVQVSTAKSLWSLTKAVLLVFLFACGSKTALTQLPPEARRAAVALQDKHPYCDDTTALPSCPCEPGAHCVDDLCLPVWEADCLPRCVPTAKPNVLCHGNVEMHGVWTGSAPKWMAVRSASESCPIGVGFTWRVWGVKPDDRDRTTLDALVLSTWTSPDANCGGKPPRPEDNLPNYFSGSTAPVYLLMPPGYGGAVGEVRPNE